MADPQVEYSVAINSSQSCMPKKDLMQTTIAVRIERLGALRGNKEGNLAYSETTKTVIVMAYCVACARLVITKEDRLL